MFTPLELSIPFGLGVISSLHCAQMCGPVVLSYSMGGRGTVAGHFCYNAGRITTYSLLGLAAGAVGHAMGFMGRMAGIQQTAAIVSGILMVIAGVLMSGAVPSKHLVQIGVSSGFSRSVGKLLLAPGALSKFALGAGMGFLPCGLLYAALLKAASTGSAASGAASMAAFGAGTAGTLLAIGLFSSAISLKLGRWSNTLASVSVTVMGAVLVWRGLIAKVPGMSCHAGL